MAIPMSWPVAEEPELDLLLENLLTAIRQVAHLRRLRRLRRMQNEHRRAESAANSGPNHHHLRQLEASGLRVSLHPLRVFYYDQEITDTLNLRSPTVPAPETNLPEEHPLPDLLNDIANLPKPNQTETESEASSSASASWMQTGADLRHIADAFEEMRTPPRENRYRKPKDLNLLSMLCPLVVNTVWPILALVLGWNVLARKR